MALNWIGDTEIEHLALCRGNSGRPREEYGIMSGSSYPKDGIFMDTLAAKDRLDQDKWRANKQSP
jgi:hypothetical protein